MKLKNFEPSAKLKVGVIEDEYESSKHSIRYLEDQNYNNFMNELFLISIKEFALIDKDYCLEFLNRFREFSNIDEILNMDINDVLKITNIRPSIKSSEGIGNDILFENKIFTEFEFESFLSEGEFDSSDYVGYISDTEFCGVSIGNLYVKKVV